MAITFVTTGGATPTQTEAGRPMTRTHEGLVAELGSHYLGDGDSTYLALVYVPATGEFETIAYCSTYCPHSDHGRGRESEGHCRAVVDASPEILAALAERRRVEIERSQAERARVEMEQAWHTPTKGAIVRVVAGRKIPIGYEGQVTWRGESDYGMRVRVKFTNGEEEFTAESNVEVIDWVNQSHRCTLG